MILPESAAAAQSPEKSPPLPLPREFAGRKTIRRENRITPDCQNSRSGTVGFPTRDWTVPLFDQSAPPAAPTGRVAGAVIRCAFLGSAALTADLDHGDGL